MALHEWMGVEEKRESGPSDVTSSLFSSLGDYFLKVLLGATIFNAFQAVANFRKREVLGPIGILKRHFVFCVFVFVSPISLWQETRVFLFMTLTKFPLKERQ